MPARRSKPRFILVDPSFDGRQGDKWQYAVTFARFAHANGYEFVLLSNEASPEIAGHINGGIKELRRFRFTFYDHSNIVSRQHDRHRDGQSLRRIQHDRDTLDRIDQQIWKARDKDDRGMVRLWEGRQRSALRQAARRALLEEKRLDELYPLAEPFNRDDFAVALAASLKELKVGAGDRLFFHTMTPAMMESLSEVTLHLESGEPLDVDAHFLFHFGKDAPDARTFLDRYHSYSHFESLGMRLRTGSPFRRMHLLATCPELVEECEALFGLPVGLFEGLTNLEEYWRALGGEAEAELARRRLLEGVRIQRAMVVAVRAADLPINGMAILAQAQRSLAATGATLRLRVLYHSGSVHLLRDLAQQAAQLSVEFVDVSENDAYLQALNSANVVLLPYEVERYAKRVSAVLHDCAVLGTSCIVPRGSTLATSADYADILSYDSFEQTPHLLECFFAALSDPAQDAYRDARRAEARGRYASDVIQRLVAATPEPSLVLDRAAPIATIVMPAWGRCGSSFAMEAQVRFLLNAGYFVVQVFVLDKAADQLEATSYFWSILKDNSTQTRGNLQRMAFSRFEDIDALDQDDAFLSSGGFDQFLARIGQASVHDPKVERLCKKSDITLVNHVFHDTFARRLGAGRFVLETHDIQSYQMASWPVLDRASMTPESLPRLLSAEMARIERYDHIVNVAPEEHTVLSTWAKSASLITPYIPLQTPSQIHATVSEMADAAGWSEWYTGIQRFQLLMVGDSHPANIASSRTFIEDVFVPYLQERGYFLCVAGKLGLKLYEELGDIPYIFYPGFVGDLPMLRMLSDITILPDRRGTGISIKTLEAFANGSPFVATTVALRGLSDRLPADVRPIDETAEMAAEIIRLIENPELMAQRAEASRRAYEAVASDRQFDQAWNAIMSSLGLRSVIQPA